MCVCVCVCVCVSPQVLPVEGQNTGSVEPLLINTHEFDRWGLCVRHTHTHTHTHTQTRTRIDTKADTRSLSLHGSQAVMPRESICMCVSMCSHRYVSTARACLHDTHVSVVPEDNDDMKGSYGECVCMCTHVFPHCMHLICRDRI